MSGNLKKIKNHFANRSYLYSRVIFNKDKGLPNILIINKILVIIAFFTLLFNEKSYDRLIHIHTDYKRISSYDLILQLQDILKMFSIFHILNNAPVAFYFIIYGIFLLLIIFLIFSIAKFEVIQKYMGKTWISFSINLFITLMNSMELIFLFFINIFIKTILWEKKSIDQFQYVEGGEQDFGVSFNQAASGGRITKDVEINHSSISTSIIFSSVEYYFLIVIISIIMILMLILIKFEMEITTFTPTKALKATRLITSYTPRIIFVSILLNHLLIGEVFNLYVVGLPYILSIVLSSLGLVFCYRNYHYYLNVEYLGFLVLTVSQKFKLRIFRFLFSVL